MIVVKPVRYGVAVPLRSTRQMFASPGKNGPPVSSATRSDGSSNALAHASDHQAGPGPTGAGLSDVEPPTGPEREPTRIVEPRHDDGRARSGAARRRRARGQNHDEGHGEGKSREDA